MSSLCNNPIRIRRQCNSSITHKTDRIIFNSFIIQVEDPKKWEMMKARLKATDSELLVYMINHGFWAILDDIDPICPSPCGDVGI